MMPPKVQEVKAMLKVRPDYMVPMMRQMLQQVLEAEMEQAVGAARASERVAAWDIAVGTTLGRW